MSSGNPEPVSKFSYRSHPHLYEINTWVWLEELSAKYGRYLRLDDVPDAEWDVLADLGFDFVYLMGVWWRSLMGRRLFRTDPRNFPNFDAALPDWKVRDIVGSPFSIQEYDPDPRITDADGLREIHKRLRTRGMGLILDFVPNHKGFDHNWILQHPDRYIQGNEEDFRRDPSAFYLLEQESVERESAGQQSMDQEGDGNLFIARGRDPYFPPWSDVAQLNYFNPECRRGMIGTLKEIAQYCDGVRCDMAMLVTNEIFSRTWGNFLKSWPAPPAEFWPEAIASVPDFVWLAEVYWDMEWRMQELGFQFTYDKRFYDRLSEGSSEQVRSHLTADLRYQNKMARFLENHDEPRCATIFPGERMTSVVTMLSTLPGMRFYHHGQLAGATTFVPMPMSNARTEPVDHEVRERYERALRLSNAEVFHAGEWQLLEVQPAGDDTFHDLIAYRWHYQAGNRLIVVNLENRTAQGKVQKAVAGASRKCLFCDLLNGNEYFWERAEIDSNGLYVKLAPYQAHLFEVQDR